MALTPDTVSLETPPCIQCGKRTVAILDRDNYLAWKGGKNIAAAFPSLTAGERETLITGTHEKCWDEIFAGDPEAQATEEESGS